MTHAIEPNPTGPVADLCADIMAHPANYKTSGGIIRSVADDRIYLGQATASGFTLSEAERKYSRGTYNFFMALHADDERREEEAARAGLAARLVRANMDRGKHAPSINGDADELRRLLVKPDQPVWADVRHVELAHRAMGLSTFAERMLPVLEGTHKIVPIGEFDDRADPKQRPESERTIAAFTCHDAWIDRLQNPYGTTIFPSIETLEAEHPRIGTLGIVELEVGLKRVVPSGDVTIETHTPGDDRAVMRDFLTDGDAQGWADFTAARRPADFDFLTDGYRVTDKGHAAINARWIDRSGERHRTRAEMREENKALETTQRARKDVPPAAPRDPPMRRGR
ncbi:hypothetical protein [Rhodopila sp.]|uniref:hypothetical protein n=1 Tax=Rhodopila sp. TaxID=2480087 RepID=UPI003D0F2FE6